MFLRKKANSINLVMPSVQMEVAFPLEDQNKYLNLLETQMDNLNSYGHQQNLSKIIGLFL